MSLAPSSFIITPSTYSHLSSTSQLHLWQHLSRGGTTPEASVMPALLKGSGKPQVTE